MDPNWGRRIDEQQRLRERGYQEETIGFRRRWLCLHCQVIVADLDTHDRLCPARTPEIKQQLALTRLHALLLEAGPGGLTLRELAERLFRRHGRPDVWNDFETELANELWKGFAVRHRTDNRRFVAKEFQMNS